MNGTGASVIHVGWTTPCCDRTPIPVGGYRYVCRSCGAVCVDTAGEIRAVFGPGVEASIAPPNRDYRVLSHDEYIAAYGEHT